MTEEQMLKCLNRPEGKIDVVLDTDAYNEIDDQFAIGYMLKYSEKLNIKGICAAPFYNARSVSPADGMIKSYNEILKLLKLAGKDEYADKVYKGSETYLPDENTPVESEASEFIAELAEGYSNTNPLYIVAIGAITNVASAIMKNPEIKEKAVIVWLGGHAQHVDTPAREFNMVQDIAAARVVFGCGVPLVQLPCEGVADAFATSKYELEYWLKGKNRLCDYLLENTVSQADSYAAGKPWTRVIWDVTAIAWLVDSDGKFMRDRLIRSCLPEYDLGYAENPEGHFMKYVYKINRDALFEDLFERLAK
ncbi:MAG: nucleoside hydrolase [Eubacteriales bacterium]